MQFNSLFKSIGKDLPMALDQIAPPPSISMGLPIIKNPPKKVWGSA